MSGVQWPTAEAMLRSTGSSRSGSFFETTSTIPRSMRISAAVFAPIPPAPSTLASSVPISSARRSLSTAMPSRSRMPCSSSSNALPWRQLVMTWDHTAASPPERSRSTSA
jgi:hypothetical protein